MNEHATKSELSLFNTTSITRNIQPLSILPTRDDIRALMNIDTFFQRPAFGTFSMELEGAPYHGIGHGVVGGLMGEPRTSPNDPIFFLHHSGVDMVWALWQRQEGHDQSDRQYLPPTREPNGDTVAAIGHHMEDPMWPWDGTLASNPDKAIPPPQQPFPPPDPDMKPPTFPDNAFVRSVDPGDIVRIRDVIDHHNLPNGTSYKYDVELPYEMTISGTKLAWIEPYFGDMSVTGTVVVNASGNPRASDLSWQMNGVTHGWLDSDTGNLHVRGQVIEDETDYSKNVLDRAVSLKHYNQPLAYLDQSGNFHLKGKLFTNQTTAS